MAKAHESQAFARESVESHGVLLRSRTSDGADEPTTQNYKAVRASGKNGSSMIRFMHLLRARKRRSLKPQLGAAKKVGPKWSEHAMSTGPSPHRALRCFPCIRHKRSIPPVPLLKTLPMMGR